MKPNPATVGSSLAVGAGIGTALGVALDNIGLWLALGVGVGVAIGAGLSSGKPKDGTPPSDADSP